MIAAEDGEQAGVFAVNAPVAVRRKLQFVIAVVPGEQRAVQKGGVAQGVVDAGDGAFVPQVVMHIEPVVKEEKQDLAVVVVQVGKVIVVKGQLENFRRDPVFLFQDPGEHHADQVAQHGLAPGRVLALPYARGPVRHFAIELLAQGGDSQGGKQPVGVDRRGGVAEEAQLLVNGGAGGGPGQCRVETGSHIDLPGGGGGHPGGYRAVGGGFVGENHRGVGGRGAGGHHAGA